MFRAWLPVRRLYIFLRLSSSSLSLSSFPSRLLTFPRRIYIQVFELSTAEFDHSRKKIIIIFVLRISRHFSFFLNRSNSFAHVCGNVRFRFVFQQQIYYKDVTLLCRLMKGSVSDGSAAVDVGSQIQQISYHVYLSEMTRDV